MIIDKIISDRIYALTNKNKQEYDILTTILSEIQRLEKSDHKNDSKILNILIKYKKDLLELKSVVYDNDILNQIDFEYNIVSKYLPQMLSEEELKLIIIQLISDLNIRNKNQLGLIMKELKCKYDGRYDGAKVFKMISTIFSE